MKDLKLSSVILDDSLPFDLLDSISRVMYTVNATDDDVRLNFDSKNISPLFVIPIMSMSDNLREKNYRLAFNPSELPKNPAMQRFFLDSGILDSMDPNSKKVVDFLIRQTEKNTIPNASRVNSHRIKLKELSTTDKRKRRSLIIQEAMSVLDTLSSIINNDNLYQFASKLIELFDNAIYHSQSRRNAYSTAIHLLNGECLIAVYDQGIGIPGAYRAYREAYRNMIHLPERNDAETIKWAMQKGTSTLQCQEGYSRGVGLHSMKDFVDRYNGTISIASGEGFYFYKRDKEDTKNLCFPLVGTLFIMRLETK